MKKNVFKGSKTCFFGVNHFFCFIFSSSVLAFKVIEVQNVLFVGIFKNAKNKLLMPKNAKIAFLKVNNLFLVHFQK